MQDTIAAICTPIGPGGIAIIRVSGPSALAVADAVFQSPKGRASDFSSHTVHLGEVRHEGRLLDQVLLTVMRAPRSYTCEDVIEINCHGGTQVARSILDACLAVGARLAQPGEFTQRAFLNGRLDLTQAEAVMDLIQARTSRALAAATQALEGHLSLRLKGIQDHLLSILAELEAHIDFPDEDISPATYSDMHQRVLHIKAEMDRLLATAREGQVLRDGVTICIVGRPNVGKSSLLNALVGRDRAIVSPTAGTTRDVVEETISIRGIPIRLSDTAGVRVSRGSVEAIGVEKMYNALRTSDIVLHVFDVSRRFSSADTLLANKYGIRSCIHVLHKSDLPRKVKIPESLRVKHQIQTSCRTGEGLEDLRDAIQEEAIGKCGSHVNEDVIINARHQEALVRAVVLTNSVAQHFVACAPPEVVAQELRSVLHATGDILGQTTPEEVLSAIFAKFCIGK